MLEKTCSSCKLNNPINNFHKHSASSDGVRAQCKDCRKVNRKRDYWADPEKDQAWGADYRKKNPEVEQRRKSNWNQINPELQRAQGHRRRVRKKENGVLVVIKKDLNKIYSSPCLACGTNDNITLGHIIPIARGGGHRVGNFVSQCLACNTSQGSMLWTEWKYSSRPRAVEVFAA